jgi:hypothetical protein
MMAPPVAVAPRDGLSEPRWERDSNAGFGIMNLNFSIQRPAIPVELRKDFLDLAETSRSPAWNRRC